MNYANIKYVDIADGPGIRTTLFVSGCRRGCKGCQNEVAWDFCYGKPFTMDVEDLIIQSIAPYYVAGLTLCGGEPFEPENESVLVPFVTRLREALPDKTVWAYSGFLFEELRDRPLLRCIDVLIDGPYVEELHSVSLPYRGSSNQRIIDATTGKELTW